MADKISQVKGAADQLEGITSFVNGVKKYLTKSKLATTKPKVHGYILLTFNFAVIKYLCRHSGGHAATIL